MAITLGFEIDEAHYDEFKTAFLEAAPNRELNARGALVFTDDEWVREWIKRIVQAQYERGVGILASKNAMRRNNIFRRQQGSLQK